MNAAVKHIMIVLAFRTTTMLWFPNAAAAGEVYNAAKIGNLTLLKVLIAKNPLAVNERDTTNNRTPLHAAAAFGHEEAVALLLAHQATVNAEDKDRLTPLYLAARPGQARLVKRLLGAGADVNVRGEQWDTPLYRAIMMKDTDVALELLNHGAKIDERDNNGYTPLLRMSMTHTPVARRMCEFLLEHGADVNALDVKEFSLLAYAVMLGDSSEVEFYIAHGAHVNPVMSKERSMLGLLISSSMSFATAPSDSLRIAYERRNASIANILIEHGALINDAAAFPGWGTALSEAIARGKLEIATVLIDHGADVNGRTTQIEQYSYAPMFAVLSSRHQEYDKSIKLLKSHGADINVRGGPSGDTPLHLACAMGEMSAVHALINNGADVHVRNSEGKLPWDMARADSVRDVMMEYETSR